MVRPLEPCVRQHAEPAVARLAMFLILRFFAFLGVGVTAAFQEVS